LLKLKLLAGNLQQQISCEELVYFVVVVVVYLERALVASFSGK
jgi:hypothetical protein